MKTIILVFLLFLLSSDSNVFAGESLEGRTNFFEGSYKSLENKVIQFPGVREHGIMINCRGEMIPAARLNAWAKALTPQSESEWNYAWNMIKSKNSAIRYIAVRSLAYGLKVGRLDLGEEQSFFDALQEPESKEFSALIKLLKGKSVDTIKR